MCHAPNKLLGTGGLSHLRVAFRYFFFHRLIRQYSTTTTTTFPPSLVHTARTHSSLSISSSEFRPPLHRKLSSIIPNKLSNTCNYLVAYELARRNMRERVDKQAVVNETLSFPSSKTGEQVLVHRPYNAADGPNPKPISPWRGPYTVRAPISPVLYLVTKDGNPRQDHCPPWQDEKIRCPSVVPRPRP